MNEISQPFLHEIDITTAAALLRVPVDTVVKLRRALDPNLSFEEHDAIFPLDLGPIWNLAAFSATKRVRINPGNQESNCSILPEWGSIFEQQSTILTHGLMNRCRLPSMKDRTFLFKQSVVESNATQVEPRVHADGGNMTACFRESWLPPTQVNLIARDVPPLTLFIKGFNRVPCEFVNRSAMEAETRSTKDFLQYAASLLRMPELMVDKNEHNRLIFNDEAIIRAAADTGKLVFFSPGRIIAFTDRSLHAGGRARFRVRQTWARAEGNFIK
jgi:hypothetical protein